MNIMKIKKPLRRTEKEIDGYLREARLDALMEKMPIESRYRWCESKACACMGAANCTGGLRANGFTKQEWIDWVKLHPVDNLSERDQRKLWKVMDVGRNYDETFKVKPLDSYDE